MRLIALTITAAPSETPLQFSGYNWSHPDPIEDLEVAIEMLQAYVVQRKSELATALASSTPIPIHE